MNKYLVLDIDILTKELTNHFKPALCESEDKPVYVLTGEDVKDILYKSHVENVKIFETKIPKTGFASLDYLNGYKDPEEEDLDSLIDSRRRTSRFI